MNDIKKIFWETIKILEKNRVLEYVVLKNQKKIQTLVPKVGVEPTRTSRLTGF